MLTAAQSILLAANLALTLGCVRSAPTPRSTGLTTHASGSASSEGSRIAAQTEGTPQFDAQAPFRVSPPLEQPRGSAPSRQQDQQSPESVFRFDVPPEAVFGPEIGPVECPHPEASVNIGTLRLQTGQMRNQVSVERQLKESLSRCFRAELASIPESQGRMRLTGSVDAAGRATAISIQTTETFSNAMLACVKQSFETVKFEVAPPGECTMRVALVFVQQNCLDSGLGLVGGVGGGL